MQKPELVEKILDYITNLYKANYIGTIELEYEDNTYKLTLGIPSYMSPTVIIGSFSKDEEFLHYIYEELRTRNYMRLEIYKVNRTNDPKEE
jgi:hypothetical protein